MALTVALGSALGVPTLIQRAVNILHRYGTNAHAYIPGVGTINGLTAGNYLLSDGSGATPVDGLTGLVLDAAGSETQLFSATGVTAGVTGSGAGITGLHIVTPVVAGRAYRINYTITACVGQLSAAIINQSNGAAQAINWTGTYSETLFATENATVAVGVIARGTGITSVTGSVTVTEVTGIHATSSGAARPQLTRGLRNLLTYSSDQSNVAWTGANLTKTASTLTRASAIAAYSQSSAMSIAIGATATVAVLAKAKTTGGAIGLRLQGTYPNRVDAVFNLLTGAVIGSSASTFTGQVATISGPDSNGYYLCALSATVAGSIATVLVNGPCETTATISSWETGSAVLSDCYVSAAGTFQGNLTAAQILQEGGIPLTTTAAASNATAGRYSHAYSGAQSLTLGSVPFQVLDDHCVVAGFRPATATTGKLFDCAASPGTAGVSLTYENQQRIYATWYDGVTSGGAYPATSTAPVGVTLVASARSVSGSRLVRTNGGTASSATNNTALSGSTTLLASVGSNVGGATNRIDGALGPVIVIKGTVSDADLLTLERFCAALTPNGPVF